MQSRSLIHQIFLWILVPIVLIAGFTYFQLNGLVNHYTTYYQKNLTSAFIQIQNDFNNIIHTNNQIATLYCNNEDVLKFISNRNADSLFQLGHSLIGSGLIDMFIVTDADGVVLARGHDEFRFNDSLLDNPYFQIATKGERFSGIGQSEGKLALISSVQIRAYDTVSLGTLILGKYVDGPLLKSMESSLHLTINIAPENTSDRIFVTTHPFQLTLKTPLEITSLNKAPFQISIAKDFLDEHQKITSIKNRILIITFITAAFALCFVYCTVNILLYPVRRLNSWLQQYDKGHIRLADIGDVKRFFNHKNELDSIASLALSTLQDLEVAKNKMAQQTEELLKTRQEALRANHFLRELRHTLEEQVENRTRQLFKKNKELLLEIDERQLAEEKIETLKNTLESIINKMPSCLVGINSEGKVRLWNSKSEELSGRSAIAVKGRNAEEALKLLGIQNDILSEIMRPDSRNHQLRKEITLQGESKHVSVVSFQYFEQGGLGTVIRIDNISKQIWMEQELLKAEKLKSIGVLAGGIAHDFNNLLTAILGSISLALCDKEISPRISSLLSTAEKASLRAKGLTNQLLTFSKGGDPVKEETDLIKIIKEYVSFATLGDKIESRFTFSDDLWHALADKDQISQVFQNMVNNAVQAMQNQGGCITISCKNVSENSREIPENIPARQYIKIVISDTGPGMEKAVCEKVFDPYFTTKQQGNGLGLAICHSIVSKHNGFISVDSKRGEGTRFTIYLPALAGQNNVETMEQVREYNYGKLRVLVMDDDAIIRELLGQMLLELGYLPFFAQNGEEAIRVYKEAKEDSHPIDIIIMDLTITKGMGGRECAAHILEFDPQARIIVSSGYSKDPIMSNYDRYGFCEAISKPYLLDEMRTVIGRSMKSFLPN